MSSRSLSPPFGETPPNPQPTVYDQMVYEIASLECVLGTLERKRPPNTSS
jgi:hypothetical protein